ncbi:MAG TPA: SpoIVB peptidase S55 domain-containing protein [Pyrinomonadaceae bacterium]|nr:SpoIVB peptidase S55 domain-containing protein [Pyrinomonadaceae bacterium]
MKKLFAVVTLALALGAPAFAQQPVSAAGPKPASFFPLEEVRPGMKGVARTVFSGSETEEFGVEVLGVMPGYPQPRNSIIIARLSGANVERTSVFAGMSGSPVFIDGKLVGAIAYAFPFAKEPIAGITPIRQMIDIFERGRTQSETGERDPLGFRREPRAVSFSELSGLDWQPRLPQRQATSATFMAAASGGSPLNGLVGQQLAPISTPVVFSGFTPQALQQFGPQLQSNGLLPLAGAGGSSPITPLGPVTEKTLAPGTSVSVQLIRGDYSVAASGTVTHRDGDRIYAFGHPFLSLGSSDMPMSESSVVTVIPNALNSFKLAVPGRMVGAMSQDRATGIYGQLRQEPKMIPVTVNLHTSRDRVETYRYEVATDEFLTPLLLNMTIYSTLTSSERSLGDSTVSVRGTIGVRGHEQIKIERRFSMANAGIAAAGSVAAPVGALLSSGFDGVELGPITLDIAASDVRRSATLDRIALDRTEARPGETFEVQAFVRTESGRTFVQRIPVRIPQDVPPGQLVLFVGDGGALQQTAASQSIVPQDLSQLVGAINRIKKNDRLYVRLYRITSGAVIGTDEMPNLPPSFVATLNSDRAAGGFTPTALSPVDEKELPPADYVITGQQLIGINIVR